VLLGVLTGGCWAYPGQQTFDGQRAYRHVIAQCDLGPRPTSSAAGWATGNYIITELEELGWVVASQEFTYKGIKGRNIVGRQGRGPIVILGAHYDTRPYADYNPVDKNQPILGANDGASGVAVLLELARSLDERKIQNEVWLVFFDAEDRGNLDGWPFSVGAEFFANALEETPEYVIVVDMIGDTDQSFFFEGNSDLALQEQIWAIAAGLGYQKHFVPEYKWGITDDHIEYKWSIIDDHTPFAKRSIKAVDIIDFDYPHWHTTQDTPDKVSPESLQRVGRVLEELLEDK